MQSAHSGSNKMLQPTGAMPSPPPTPAHRGSELGTPGIGIIQPGGHNHHNEHLYGSATTTNGVFDHTRVQNGASPLHEPPTPVPSPTPRQAATFPIDLKHPPSTPSLASSESTEPHATFQKPKGRSFIEERDRNSFPRISKPVELLRSEYDVVVIGSGYGGGVAASRMARAGQSVCVLERGCEKWPGEYPESTVDAMKELHVSGEFAPSNFLDGKQMDAGDPTGMFHLVFGKGQNAVVGNGLGGTSLMNANVFMEADKGTLSLKAWPKEIREDPDGLDKCE